MAYQFTWHPIELGNLTIYVTRDAVKENGVRINVTAREAQLIADELDAYLTTGKIEDIIYEHAGVHIAPQLGVPGKTTAAEHSAKIDALLAGSDELVSTVGKSWILSNKATSAKAVNYGWHTTGKSKSSGPWPSLTIPGINVWQQPGTAHNLDHRDYSQTLRLVSRQASFNGDTIDLAEILTNPEYAKLLSHEGPVPTWQPGVAPSGGGGGGPGGGYDVSSYPSKEHWARAMIIEAFKKNFEREPTLLEAQFAQAVSRGESNYGSAAYLNRETGEKHTNTWNMGGVQCGIPPCVADCFEATDTHTDGTPYQACFRKYATPVEGFKHFIKVLYINRNRKTVLAAANTGSIEKFSTALRASGYFELALDKHIKAIRSNLEAITQKLGEPMPSGSSGGIGGLALLLLFSLPVVPILAWVWSKKR